MLKRLFTLFRHRWSDAAASRRALPPPARQRLKQAVAASEQRHSGQVRICVEAGLPMSYLWRHAWQGQALSSVVRQRAVTLFGKLGIWDTEQNNGVLIYLLLAEHAIEVVADRGLSRHVTLAQWRTLVQRLGTELQAHRFEDGLMQALGEVSAMLEQHFPAQSGLARPNEISDAVQLL
jgi:uncharacterized membrane protein